MHIVFLILKIIGIILLILLGILLLLTGIVLFAPFKYQAEGSYHGKLQLRARGTWLFHLLRIRAEYDLENGLRWQAAFAWIRRPKKERPNGEPKEASDNEETVDAADDAGLPVEAAASDTDEPETALQMMESGEKTEDGEETEADEERGNGGLVCRIKKWLQRIRNWIMGFWKRIKRIKYTFRNICDKIKTVNDKRAVVRDFIQDPQNQRIFRYAWGQMRFILRRLRPKKCCITGTIGFEDPALTGQVFGGIAVLYAWFGPVIQVSPDFEEEIIDVEFLAKGRFRLIYVLIAGMRLMMDRETRRLLMKLRKQFS